MKEVYGTTVLAKMMSVSVTRVYQFVYNNRFTPDYIVKTKNGRNCYFFNKETIDKIVRRYEKSKDKARHTNSKVKFT
jgi:hypothetical protein